MYDEECYLIPKGLLQDEFYSALSVDAIFVYTILKEKQKEAVLRHWIDEEGNIYLSYSIEELMKLFGYSRSKMVVLMRSLEEHNLIERDRVPVFYGHSLPYRTYINEI